MRSPDRLARDHDLTVQLGDMVVELRAPGPNKADATTAFMAEPPFAGRVPVFVGDDFTDEDGFAAAQRLGGYGVVVGQRRPTRARYALGGASAPPGSDWLATSLIASRGRERPSALSGEPAPAPTA